MSLNGLDSTAVLQAYHAALALPEGWFLLNYVARDEVGVLDQGAAGWEEARSSLSQYAESSPLYGFLQYRGRRIVIKYVPDGTSRLLKVRTAVHYQTLADHFEHDASLEATSYDEMTAQTLSAACSLPEPEIAAPPPSIPPRAPGRSRGNTARTSQSGAHDEEVTAGDKPSPPDDLLISSTSTAIDLDTTSTRALTDQTGMAVEYVPERLDSAATSPKTPRGEVDVVRENLQKEEQSNVEEPISKELYRTSDSEQERPSTSASSKSEFFKSTFYNWKPKAKLFPRPVAEDKSNKSKGSGTIRQKLPSGMKSKKVDEERPKTSKSFKSLNLDTSTLPSQQAHSSRPNTTDIGPTLLQSPSGTTEISKNHAAPHVRQTLFQNERRHYTSSAYVGPESTGQASEQWSASKSGVFVSSEAKVEPSPDSWKRSNVISPERQRLMKALQMRKMQRLNSIETQPTDVQAIETVKQPNDHSLTFESKTDSGVELDIDKDIQFEQVRSDNDVEKDGAYQISTVTRTAGQVYSEKENGYAQFAAAHNIGMRTSEFTQSRNDKRASLIGRLQTDVAADGSSTASDDSLAHELASATVEEATPISVARSVSQTSPETAQSPLMAIDQRSNPRCVTPILIRPTSRGNTLSRKSSGTPEGAMQLTQHTSPSKSETGRPSFLKKSNVSSGISRRIQALAEISSRETSPNASPTYGNSPEASSSSFLGFRKPSSPDNMSRASSLQRPSLAGSRGSSLLPAAVRSRTKIDTTEAVYKVPQENQASDTVSITARIVRGPSDKDFDLQGQPSSKSQLYRSPLIIEHQPAGPKRPGSKSGVSRDERLPTELARPISRESSLTALTRQSVEMSWRLASRGKSDTTSPPPPPKSARSMSSTSLDPVNEVTENKRESKESITSRMLKRMSGLSAGSKKKAESSDSVAVPHVIQSNSLRGVVIGDLNVQLPDTLLWKWRWVEIDAFGNVVVSSSRSNERAKSVPKKYHLSEFRSPVVPTLDRQELPHSVVLEFINEGTLQFACEDSVAQAQVFKRLLDTHHAWISLER